LAEVQAREAKLIQYLNEAYGKEQELVTALESHISLTTRDSYKKRLKDHLKETKAQAKGLERRIKQLGGKAEKVDLPGPDAVGHMAATAQGAAQKAMAMAKGPLHAVRGTGEAEKMLKNAKTEFWNEAEEIANYNAIETLADALGDRDTAKLAREYRRQEERMAKFLEKTIQTLTREVVRDEIPASQRNGGASKPRASRSASSSRASSSRASSSRSNSGSSRSSSSRSSAARGSSARSSGGAKGSTTRRTPATRAAAASRSASSASKSTSSRAKAKSGSKSPSASRRSTGSSSRAKRS
jgi:ferritin-like metal-binding protein YciE